MQKMIDTYIRKQFYHFFALLLVLVLAVGCEDVVDVEVPKASPRLSIDALIRLDTSQNTTTVRVIASLTNSFFGEITPASLSSISIINQDYIPSEPLDTQELPLFEVAPGVYEGSKGTNFFTKGELKLTIEHNNQKYLAITRFVPSVPLVSLVQGSDTLFTGEETEVEVTFLDENDRSDFYLVDLDFGDYLVTEDKFYNGQSFTFSYFYDNRVKKGRTIEISLLGVDEPFYNYMNQLIVQSGINQDPFQTPSAAVRGNILNVTNFDNTNSSNTIENSDNFVLGYFAICQTFTKTITIK